MKKGSWFFDEKGFRYRCEEVLSQNLFVASENGHGNYAFIQKENGRFSRVVPKFTPGNVVAGSMVTGAFRNARWNVLGIEGEKVRGEVDFFTPDNRVVRKEFSDWDFSIFLGMLNSVFIVIPTKEDLPCDCKFISPQNAPNWKFRIIEEYGDDIVLVEIFYKKEKIDTRKVPRSLIAKWMNTPFEFGEPEMKGKEKRNEKKTLSAAGCPDGSFCRRCIFLLWVVLFREADFEGFQLGRVHFGRTG